MWNQWCIFYLAILFPFSNQQVWPVIGFWREFITTADILDEFLHETATVVGLISVFSFTASMCICSVMQAKGGQQCIEDDNMITPFLLLLQHHAVYAKVFSLNCVDLVTSSELPSTDRPRCLQIPWEHRSCAISFLAFYCITQSKSIVTWPDSKVGYLGLIRSTPVHAANVGRHFVVFRTMVGIQKEIGKADCLCRSRLSNTNDNWSKSTKYFSVVFQ